MGGSIRSQGLNALRFAGRTVEVCLAPGLGRDPGLLRSTLVPLQFVGWEAEVHSGIRSRSRTTRKEPLSQVDFGFGLDDEEGVGVGAAGGTEFLAGFFEGIGHDGKDDAAVGTADEVKAAFLLDELKLAGHACAIRSYIGSIHGSARRIN